MRSSSFLSAMVPPIVRNTELHGMIGQEFMLVL